MSVESYKCPGCGAPVSFNPKIGGFKCAYCGKTCTEDELAAFLEQTESKNAQKRESAAASGTDASSDEVMQYTCPSCGAEVVVGDTATTSFCYYCHSPVIIESRLRGDFKPDKIIPFKIDKKDAVEKFSEWIKGKRYVPRDFTTKAQEANIAGMYLPYWDVDVTANVDYHAVGIKRTTWQQGDNEYTRTDEYQIDRTGKLSYNNMRELAFSKINQDLINGINPYDAADERKFSSGYLSGFQSERYTVGRELIVPVAQNRAKSYTLSDIQNSANCNTFANVRDNTTYAVDDVRYTLLPTWVLNYKYKGKDYQFAVNGQTGKSYGDLPVSNGKLFAHSLALGVLVAALAILGGLFLW
ncbi:MAG: hypothetical protein J6I73_06770 [Treponema sp.]|nr:hypothetical protein [Treponema sp.]